VQLKSYTPTSIEFHVDAAGHGLLVVSEVFYPGWNAFVNGARVPIHRVNGFLRGVVVPHGPSIVTFQYKPLSVQIGATLSVLTLMAFFGLGLRL